MATAERKSPNAEREATASDGSQSVEVVKASFNLPARELDTLRGIARRRLISVTQALRQAIALYAFFAEQPEGTKFLVQDPDGSRREVLFHGT